MTALLLLLLLLVRFGPPAGLLLLLNSTGFCYNLWLLLLLKVWMPTSPRSIEEAANG